ncbi:MAG: glycine zipper domain-containing protein [Planctomycetota bacterium]
MRGTSALLIAVLALGPLVSCGTARGDGAGIGALFGAGIGAAVDRHNGWRGAAIGGALGALTGYAIGSEIDRERDEVRWRAHHERRVIVHECRDDYGARYRVQGAPYGETQVETRVTRFDPQTGEWIVVSETVQRVD